MKHCRWCSQDKPLGEFYIHPMMADGHLNKCKEGVKSYAKERRLTSDRPREIDARRYREGRKVSTYVERFPERARLSAHVGQQARRAIAAGKLVRAEQCEWCGQATFCEAAHHDYSKPLEVLWLCVRCHRRWDANDPKTAGVAS